MKKRRRPLPQFQRHIATKLCFNTPVTMDFETVKVKQIVFIEHNSQREEGGETYLYLQLAWFTLANAKDSGQRWSLTLIRSLHALRVFVYIKTKSSSEDHWHLCKAGYRWFEELAEIRTMAACTQVGCLN